MNSYGFGPAILFPPTVWASSPGFQGQSGPEPCARGLHPGLSPHASPRGSPAGLEICFLKIAAAQQKWKNRLGNFTQHNYKRQYCHIHFYKHALTFKPMLHYFNRGGLALLWQNCRGQQKVNRCGNVKRCFKRQFPNQKIQYGWYPV